jgi:ketosteroid isomerase-like protein
MKKYLLLLLVGFTLTQLTAQSAAEKNTQHLRDINRDIWQPFIVAYGSMDAELYKSLHTMDFIRAQGDSKTLPTRDAYFGNSAKWFADVKQKGEKLAIQFRFTERFANGEVGSERGIYELKSFDKDGKLLWTGYGKFHVFLKKQVGVWKIAVDYDSNEKNTMGEEAYQAAFGLEEFEKY